MNLFFTIATLIGLGCALIFTIIYASRERRADGTKMDGWWKSQAGRLIMADSLVLVMIYGSGFMFRLVSGWHLSEEFRVGLTLFAVSVVAWRLAFLIAVRRKKS
jgi:hypothetical protein